jgi:hypothetical protein
MFYDPAGHCEHDTNLSLPDVRHSRRPPLPPPTATSPSLIPRPHPQLSWSQFLPRPPSHPSTTTSMSRPLRNRHLHRRLRRLLPRQHQLHRLRLPLPPRSRRRHRTLPRPPCTRIRQHRHRMSIHRACASSEGEGGGGEARRDGVLRGQLGRYGGDGDPCDGESVIGGGGEDGSDGNDRRTCKWSHLRIWGLAHRTMLMLTLIRFCYNSFTIRTAWV